MVEKGKNAVLASELMWALKVREGDAAKTIFYESTININTYVE